MATRPRTVVLRLTVIGSGTVRVSGSHAFTCHAYSCRNTFHLSSGRLTVARALPVAGWKLTTWAGACVGSTATCSLRLQTRRSVAVTFVPPGARLNAFRLGKAVRMPEFEQGGVWRMKVKSATINADAAVEAVIDPYTSQPYNGPPGPGVQYTLVNLSLTHVRGGSASPSRFVIRKAQLAAEGAHSGSYTPDACAPPSPDLEALPNDRVLLRSHRDRQPLLHDRLQRRGHAPNECGYRHRYSGLGQHRANRLVRPPLRATFGGHSGTLARASV